MQYKVNSGAVYDALRILGLEKDSLLHKSIRPLDPQSRIYGEAFTTFGEYVRENYEEADKIRHEIYPKVNDQHVIVLSARDDLVAHSGDITSTLYKGAGARGFVTDGNVRDSRRIVNMGFPCFCSGTNPVDAIDRWAITGYQVPILLPGYFGTVIQVVPGDIIWGDADGVFVIPKDCHQKFIDELVKVMDKEDWVRRKIIQGHSSLDIHEEVGRW